jgi:hypothetical protein
VTWWKWGIAGALLVMGIWGSGFRVGVLTQRKDDAEARLRLGAALDSVKQDHAATVAVLQAEVVSRGVERARAEADAKASQRQADAARRDAAVSRQALHESATALDSLAAYPPLVAALDSQVVALDSTVTHYRVALSSEVARSGLLTQRIAADSLLIDQQRRALATMIPADPKKQSGWACVAGVGVTTGIRAGAGFGLTCGRRLR